MKILGLILYVIGALMLGISTFVWGGHAIYQLFTTDAGFWTVVGINLFGWVATLIIGAISAAIGYVMMER